MDWEQEQIRCKNLPYHLNDNITYLLDGFKRAVYEKNTSAVILVDGKSGLGKSTLSFQLARYLDPTFDLNKIHYNPDTFLEGTEEKIGLVNAKQGDCLVFDEALVLSNRSSLSVINKMIVQAMSMIRSKNLFIIFAANSIFDLDKNLAIFRAEVLFHVYGSSLTDRGKVMAFFKGGDEIDRLKMLYLMGKKFYDYSRPKSNFFTKFPKHFAVDEEEYERQKQIGVNSFLKGADMSGKTKRDLIVEKAILSMYNESKLNQKEIADKLGVTQQAISYIIRRSKNNNYEANYKPQT